MSRSRRPFLPGATFHLTARLHVGVGLLTEADRSVVRGFIAQGLARSDVSLLAYAIMPNHVHLVVRQGSLPLQRAMQPILRRTALFIQRQRGFVGHVFERRYRHRICLDPAYLRNSIVYTHLNPVRANLCVEPTGYEWTSHHLFCDPSALRASLDRHVDVADALRLFAERDDASVEEQSAAYRAYAAWRREIDLYRSAAERGLHCGPAPRCPSTDAGDAAWAKRLAPLFVGTEPTPGKGRGATLTPRLDMRDIARQVAAERLSDPHRYSFQGRRISRELLRVRHVMIHRMSAAGYRGHQIARYFQIADSTVSNVLAGRSGRPRPG